MTVYIAGPMSGKQEYNYPAFFAAEERLRSKGHKVLNPAKIGMLDSYESYWPINKAMIDGADAIYMLRGWRNSSGATSELKYACQNGCQCWFEEWDEQKGGVTN